MPDALSKDMSIHLPKQPRRQFAGRARTIPGARLAASFAIAAVCCVVPISASAAPPAGASPLSARVADTHRHLSVPWAPVGVPGNHGPVPGLGSGSLGTAQVSTAPTGIGASELAVDPATHTVYVTNGYNDNGPVGDGDTVSVIDTRHCQAQDISRCHGPWPTITVGSLPSSIAVDEATGTVYVTNWGDNTVSVFDGATCNAMNTSGCAQQPATVPVGLARSASTSTTPTTLSTSLTRTTGTAPPRSR